MAGGVERGLDVRSVLITLFSFFLVVSYYRFGTQENDKTLTLAVMWMEFKFA
jgi:hypothetical protein